MKKRLLVDLSSLKNIYSGLGQIALSYGNYFKESYKSEIFPYDITLLLPRKYFGEFGNEVNYLSSSNFLRKIKLFPFPKYDIWHSIHQLSRYRPIYKDTKYVLTIHDLNFLYEKTANSRQKRFIKIQNKVDRANEIVCISHFTKKEVEKNLSLKGKECKVIYNRVPLIKNDMAVKPTFEINEPFFFTLGVINPKKNFHVLLDMMKLMPDRHLYITGIKADIKQNSYANLIKLRIKQENIQNVTLRGPVTHEEKVWMYQNCQAFLFPSLLEGFGLPVIEAMQFGKPVFTSVETSLKEIGGEFAYFWKNFNPIEMKKLIEDNLDKFYQNNTLIEKEKEYAQIFSCEQHFNEYDKLYRSV
jgi:glycosyltransferase involved in cell wall biosynthesis